MLLNEVALQLVDDLVQRRQSLAIAVHDDGINVPVIDCGIDVPGSLEAGLALARVCTAGQANIQLVSGDRLIHEGPAVSVHSDRPVAACLAAQYAGWQVTVDDFVAMGSGPMRAAAGREGLFERIGHREDPRVAVGVLETRRLPPPHVGAVLAQACDVEPRKLTLLVAPTASLAGTVQIAARSLETALHKLHELQFDLHQIVSGWGIAPLPPVAADDLQAMGRTNDAVLYGGQVQLWVRGDDEQLADLTPTIPSSASPDHGRPFAEILEAYDRDFYRIDPLLFSPAWIRINNLHSGRSFQAGQVLPELLRRSFGT